MGRIKQEEVIDLTDCEALPSHKRNLQLLEEAFGDGGGDIEGPPWKRARPLSHQEPYRSQLAAVNYRDIDATGYQVVDTPVNRRATESHALNYDDPPVGELYDEAESEKSSFKGRSARYPKTLFSYDETESQTWDSDADAVRHLVARNPFQDPWTKGDEYVGDLRTQIQELQDFLVKETGKKSIDPYPSLDHALITSRSIILCLSYL